MSARTKDYVAHEHHLGRTLYTAAILAWAPDPAEREYRATRTFPSAGLAKSWVRRVIGGHVTAVDDDTHVWAEVRRGRWERDRFDDGAYGTVTDAEWVEDDDWFLDGGVNDDGTIEWAEWS